MAALDHALCKQGKPSAEELKDIRPLVDRMASTFGFPTERLDRLLKGQKVEVYRSAFTTQRSSDAFRRRIQRMMDSQTGQEGSDG
jgi:hypothetical protein